MKTLDRSVGSWIVTSVGYVHKFLQTRVALYYVSYKDVNTFDFLLLNLLASIFFCLLGSISFSFSVCPKLFFFFLWNISSFFEDRTSFLEFDSVDAETPRCNQHEWENWINFLDNYSIFINKSVHLSFLRELIIYHWLYHSRLGSQYNGWTLSNCMIQASGQFYNSEGILSNKLQIVLTIILFVYILFDKKEKLIQKKNLFSVYKSL